MKLLAAAISLLLAVQCSAESVSASTSGPDCKPYEFYESFATRFGACKAQAGENDYGSDEWGYCNCECVCIKQHVTMSNNVSS